MTDRNGFRAIRSVDYIIIPCHDFLEKRRFYTKIPGFELYDEDEQWVGIQVVSLLGVAQYRAP